MSNLQDHLYKGLAGCFLYSSQDLLQLRLSGLTARNPCGSAPNREVDLLHLRPCERGQCFRAPHFPRVRAFRCRYGAESTNQSSSFLASLVLKTYCRMLLWVDGAGYDTMTRASAIGGGYRFKKKNMSLP